MAHLQSRKELVAEVMALWRKYGSEYRTLPHEYEKALNELRKSMDQGRIPHRSLFALTKTTLREYPKIQFLGFIRESDALKHVTMLDQSTIRRLIRHIKAYDENATVVSMRSRLFDYKYLIRCCGLNRGDYFGSMNPDRCGSGKHNTAYRVPYVD